MPWRKSQSERECFQALYEFRQPYRDQPTYKSGVSSGATSFPVNVIYKWDGKKKHFATNININHNSGPEDGSVELERTNSLNVDDFHLGFKPHFQDYHYNEDSKTLIISGSSDKMNGDYLVEISGDF